MYSASSVARGVSMGGGDTAPPIFSLCRLSIVLVNGGLLITLNKYNFFRKLSSNQLFLSAYWGCAPHQQFSLLLPLSADSIQEHYGPYSPLYYDMQSTLAMLQIGKV